MTKLWGKRLLQRSLKAARDTTDLKREELLVNATKAAVAEDDDDVAGL